MFLSEDEIIGVLQHSREEAPGDENEVNFVEQQALAVVWDNDDGRNWYLGFYLDKNMDGTVRIDHMEQLSTSANGTWTRPSSDDIQDVKLM